MGKTRRGRGRQARLGGGGHRPQADYGRRGAGRGPLRRSLPSSLRGSSEAFRSEKRSEILGKWKGLAKEGEGERARWAVSEAIPKAPGGQGPCLPPTKEDRPRTTTTPGLPPTGGVLERLADRCPRQRAAPGGEVLRWPWSPTTLPPSGRPPCPGV